MAEADTTGLWLDRLTVSHCGQPVVTLDCRVPQGRVLTVMGPSGSGKSTLLNAVIGSLPRGFSAFGRVWLNGVDLTALQPEQRRIGILYQDALLFPHLSVGGNLAFGLGPHLRGRAARAAAVSGALDEVGLAGMEDRDPATLSGGQKARVALMRTLLAEPRALLLDEPFSRLDADLRQRVRETVFSRARDRGLPALLVTHDAGDAEAAGGTVIEI